MRNKILFVDDDEAFIKMLSQYFSRKGYEIMTASNGRDAIEKVKEKPDIILLDINLPGMDGLEICRKIRDKTTSPIIFLTAKVEEQDRVNGLLSGGDDYVVKPFSLKELEARVIAHLKREERHRNEVCYRFSEGLMIDYASRKVQIGDTVLELTKTEYEIIELLSMHPGQVFSKERIYERVCGYDGEGDSRGITELVRRIRNKFAAQTQTEYIETVWGMGYQWKR